MLNRLLTPKRNKTKSTETQTITSANSFCTVTHDNRIKPLHFLVKHETVLFSQKDGFHPILTDF